jgi:glycosyltransferase involved in cell wall biosynthesis
MCSVAMPKVSVLVAVYNAETFLAECLDSLLAQTLSDIEVICVDDASTDGSLCVLQDYARRDARIEVQHLDSNQGQAHARNVALRAVRGEYVCFLDADDWFSPDTLQRMVDAFDDDTDCVLLDVIRHFPDHEEPYEMLPFTTLSGNEAFRLSLTWQIHGVYGVRTAIHQRYPYDETCRSYSDDNTTRLHFLTARRVGRCRGVYHYRQHSGSVTHQVSVRRFDYLRANESMRRQLLQLGVDAALVAVYENHRWLNLVDVYMFYHVHGHELSEAERNYGLQELHRVWRTVDRTALDKQTTTKFGYRPCCSWTLFRLQEWCYFTLRTPLGKNR